MVLVCTAVVLTRNGGSYILALRQQKQRPVRKEARRLSPKFNRSTREIPMTKKPAARDHPMCDDEGQEAGRSDLEAFVGEAQEQPENGTAPEVVELTEMFPDGITAEVYIEDKSGNMQRATMHFVVPQWLRDAIEKPREVVLKPRFSNFVKRTIKAIIIAIITAAVTYMMKDIPIFNGLLQGLGVIGF
jgi:hypothetical protein